MMKRHARIFLLPALLAAISASLAAQTPVGGQAQVIVRVRVAGGDLLRTPAVVRLFSASNNIDITAGTRDNGQAVFSNVPLGSYTVEVKVVGYQTGREEVSLPIPATAEVMVTLQPESDFNSQPASGPAVLAPKAREETEKGLEALRANKLDAARRHLEAAQKLAPNHPDVLYLLGVFYFQSNDLERAQEELEKAVSYDANHARATALLGTVLFNRGKDLPAAIAMLEKAVSLNSSSWETHWTLGRAYYQAREYPNARAEAERAWELSKGKAPEIQLLLAQTSSATGDLDKSEKELEAFLKNNPDHPKAAQARGWLERLRQEIARRRRP